MHSLADAVGEKARLAHDLYHRLVLIVDEQRAGNTDALKEVGERIGVPVVNVSLELSRRLLDLAERQRPRHVQHLLQRIVAETGDDIVLLDHIELLFDVSLRQDPLRLLRHLSRHRTVIAVWNGSIVSGFVRFSQPGHPEHRRYPLDGILTVNPQASTQ